MGHSVSHKTDLITLTLSQCCDYDGVKMSSVKKKIVSVQKKYYFKNPTLEHSCGADDLIFDVEIVSLKTKMGKTKSNVLQILFHRRRIIAI